MARHLFTTGQGRKITGPECTTTPIPKRFQPELEAEASLRDSTRAPGRLLSEFTEGAY